MAKKLRERALLDDDFGLRQRFPWVRVDLNDSHIQTYIRSDERRYLAKLMSDIFDEDFYDLDIERIENPYLWGRYVLRYEEMKAPLYSRHVKEQIMIHATSYTNATEISKNNFDWRLVSRAQFGKGVSFASNAGYARHRATRNDVYIVAGVLVANSSPGYKKQKIPDGLEDTTTGYTPEVCIKYSDNDFYPYYIIE